MKSKGRRKEEKEGLTCGFLNCGKLHIFNDVSTFQVLMWLVDTTLNKYRDRDISVIIGRSLLQNTEWNIFILLFLS